MSGEAPNSLVIHSQGSHRMSNLHRPDAELDEQESSRESSRSPFSEVAGRFANWITGIDRMSQEQLQTMYRDDEHPLGELTAPAPSEEPSRFPLAPFGYNRAAVDEHLFTVERELAELRAQRQPAVSITEELERIGEQTASILVVAHDQAHETTRQAQEQADRCIADAAANAVAITAQAKQRLGELDSETDSVWRERERLLEDVRVVSAALATLADEASQRFPAAEPAPAEPVLAEPVLAEPALAEPVPAEPVLAEPAGPAAAAPAPSDPQATAAFFPFAPEAAQAADGAAEPQRPAPGPAIAPAQDFDSAVALPSRSPAPLRGRRGLSSRARSGDTGSWLSGFEPPDHPLQ
jgi:DivIVA protein